MDDLTVRTGRVVDGKFYTDSAADQAVREACAKGSSQAAPQSPESAMEALGFKPKPPGMTGRGRTLFTRPEPEPLGALNPGGFRVVGLTRGGLCRPCCLRGVVRSSRRQCCSGRQPSV